MSQRFLSQQFLSQRFLVLLTQVVALLIATSCAALATPVPTRPQDPGDPRGDPREEVIPIQVIVIVSPDVAFALHHPDPPTGESRALLETLLQTVEDSALTLQPMHPGTSDPALQTYFIVETPDAVTAQQIIDRLLPLETVMAAYVKPLDALP